MEPVQVGDPSRAVLWALSLYGLVLGFKFAVLRRGDLRTLGVGLLVASLGWVLTAMGVEAEIPLTVTLPEGGKETIVIPLLRTLAEMGVVVAALGGFMVALSAAVVAATGGDLIRLQKAVIRIGLVLLGLTVIWQMHFAGQFSLRNLLFGLGGAGVFVVGLGLQRTMGNLFSGFDLQADKVIKKGDFVQLGVGGPEGVVADTSLRTTRIHSVDGQMMIVANSDLLQRNLLNLDQPDRRLRVRRTVGVTYDVPPMRVKDAILDVLRQDHGVLKAPQAPAPVVYVLGYGESSLNYEVRFWVADRRLMDDVVDRVMTRIWYALHEQSIEIPFAVRTVRTVDMHAEAERRARSAARTEQLERAVSQCPLFTEQFLTAAQRRELVQDSLECALQPGEFAVRRGERSDHMYLLLEGAVLVQPEGRPQIDLAAPAWFGEIALLRGEPRTADVVGGPHGARLLRMSKVSVMPALERNPRLANELSKVSDARREASGVVDEEPERLSMAQRVTRLVRGTFREMRPW